MVKPRGSGRPIHYTLHIRTIRTSQETKKVKDSWKDYVLRLWGRGALKAGGRRQIAEKVLFVFDSF